MGDKTGIQWTDATWNPLRGCSRVSEGCRNCYAEKMAGRFCGPGQPYEGLITIGEKGPRWNGKTKTVPHKLDEPLRWTKPRMVFVNSMSDLFHESVSFEFIALVFSIMAASPIHTFQVLTKRPARMREWFKWAANSKAWSGAAHDDGWNVIAEAACSSHEVNWPAWVGEEGEGLFDRWRSNRNYAWPLPNVWLGVSVEDQITADERIPLLLDCPAAVRWVSYEPALGPVNFNATPSQEGFTPVNGFTMDDLRGCLPRWQRAPLQECMLSGGLDWIVVGGESGPGARPFQLDWARSVIRQGKAARVPVFVKQLGACASDERNGIAGKSLRVPSEALPLVSKRLKAKKGDDMSEWPAELRVRQWPEVAQ